MTKIEEIEQKLDNAVEKFRLEMNECKKELAELKEIKKECKWKPTVGEKYWFKNDIGKVSHSTYMCSVDGCRANNVLLFKTEEECERYWHFMNTVKEKSYSFSEEEWEDGRINKYSIQYFYGDKTWFTHCTSRLRSFGKIYFKDRESAQYIIDNFKEELTEYFL